MSFVHLHVHSHYSLLDGVGKIPELVARAAALGMPALALTDHGSLYGLVEFYQEARAQGIKPILGMEAYVAPHELWRKRARLDDHPSHLILLAATTAGYRNLLELATIAQLDGFYYKPRLDWQTLERLHTGLIGLSGCHEGEIPRLLKNGQLQEAAARAERLADIFGLGNFYIELTRNPRTRPEITREQEVVNERLVTLASDLGLPVVATADVHYLDREDQAAQDILLCIGTGTTVGDDNRLDMRGTDLSFANEETMQQRFADLPEALANTTAIAQRCDVKLTLGKWYFPEFPLPPRTTPHQYLEEIAQEGLHQRLTHITSEAHERLAYELSIIKKKGYATYFLVVADFVKFTHERGIITTTRGSAAGSLVAYALGITTLNPLDYELPFERFLNPERPSPPDIDVDLADNRRDEVIEYVTKKYGRDRVARICTFGTLLARAAVRDVARALGYPYSLGDRVAKLIPVGSQGSAMTITRAKLQEPRLVSLASENPEVAQILALAEPIEGNARHASVHAAGVVVAPSPLTDFTPLQRERAGHIITQYDMGSCEDVGLLKIDFLGIRNLSIIGEALKIIRATTAMSLDLDRITLDDARTYELLSSGRTVGLFQLGGTGMTRYLKELKPTNIFDIMAMISLFRPGPMESIPEYIRRKHNPDAITYLHLKLKPILERSLGILVFQDDVLLIAVRLAGYTWAEADKLRKAIGKKIPREMQMQREKFIQGCTSSGGLPETKAEELWRLIEPFAAYGFNKAHAASYAIIAYQTAYLKAHYQAQFMTAVLTAESADLDTVAEGVAECRKLGIEVLPPDINESRSGFTYVADRTIRFGLGAIKNLGSDLIHAAIREREARGAYATLTDFLLRLPKETFNKKSLESLIRSGALDRFGERNSLALNIERMLEFVRDQDRSASQQQSLFGSPPSPSLRLSPAPPLEENVRLAWEKELLGLYVTAHPFTKISLVLRDVLHPIAHELERRPNRADVAIAGILTHVKELRTKKGDLMAFATIEDEVSQAELVVFPRLYQDTKDAWVPDSLLIIRGKIDASDQTKKIIVDHAAKVSPDTIREAIVAASNRSASPPNLSYRNFNPEIPTALVPSGKVLDSVRLDVADTTPHFPKDSAARKELVPTQRRPNWPSPPSSSNNSSDNGHITITLGDLTNEVQTSLRSLLLKHPGTSRVYLRFAHQGRTRTIETSFAIEYDDRVREEIEVICGENTVIATQLEKC